MAIGSVLPRMERLWHVKEWSKCNSGEPVAATSILPKV